MKLQNGNVIYQCYPRTFADGNGDGIGDFTGIEQRMQYLEWLGINGLWMSPHYRSPGKDGGYDVSDYLTTNPVHGTIADFVQMTQAANERDIDIIADFVPSHSSDKHPYFQAALQDPTADTYIFRPAHPYTYQQPNNWLSVFPKRTYNPATQTYDVTPESAWRYVGDVWPHADPARLDQFVLTSFAAYQPNWNHASPQVQEYLKAAARTWFAHGVKGLRIDAIDYMDHDRQYRDEQPNPCHSNRRSYDSLLREKSMRGPKATKYLRSLLSVLDEFPDTYAMLETYPDRNVPDSDPVAHYLKYYREVGDWWPGRVAPFCFEITDLPWDANQYSRALNDFLRALKPGDIPVFPGGNHDKDRIASRYGERAARAAAVLQLTLPGVAVIYQGDELGMTNHMNIPHELRTDPYLERDVARSPLPMHARDKSAGYSTAPADKFALPIHPDYARFNVETQKDSPVSMLNLYKQLIAFRGQPAMRTGAYVSVESTAPEIFAFARSAPGDCTITVTNFSSTEQYVGLADIANKSSVVISSEPHRPPDELEDTLMLAANEAVVLRPHA